MPHLFKNDKPITNNTNSKNPISLAQIKRVKKKRDRSELHASFVVFGNALITQALQNQKIQVEHMSNIQRLCKTNTSPA
ncbi:hypothetical protein AVL57_01695 [Alteromonas stellipolaris]|jgi:hypothetical protein|uniref:Uncharacterized protein n=1 Tax=Alteromonas stellipolaris TaxID=233316 RepID=A0ABN4LIA2_9ALTE|nr:hypothetical protein AVL57_01695 [Alteromonas stellipolaris]